MPRKGILHPARRTSLLAMLSTLSGVGAAWAGPLAATATVHRGALLVERGNPPKYRKVENFASLEENDTFRTSKDAEVEVATFDSNLFVPDSKGVFKILRDGIYQKLGEGRLRVHQFSVPVGSRKRARDFQNLIGSVGVLKVSGLVDVKRAHARRFEPIRGTLDLQLHDQVRTSEHGWVYLSNGDNLRLVADSDTVFSLQKDYLALERGRVWMHWDPRDQRFQFATPTGLGEIRRSVIEVVHTGEEKSVRVLDGRAVFRPQKGAARIGTGQVWETTPESPEAQVRSFLEGREARSRGRRIRQELRSLVKFQELTGDFRDRIFQTFRPQGVAPEPEEESSELPPDEAEEGWSDEPPSFSGESLPPGPEAQVEEPYARVPEPARPEEDGWQVSIEDLDPEEFDSGSAEADPSPAPEPTPGPRASAPEAPRSAIPHLPPSLAAAYAAPYPAPEAPAQAPPPVAPAADPRSMVQQWEAEARARARAELPEIEAPPPMAQPISALPPPPSAPRAQVSRAALGSDWVSLDEVPKVAESAPTPALAPARTQPEPRARRAPPPRSPAARAPEIESERAQRDPEPAPATRSSQEFVDPLESGQLSLSSIFQL